MAQTELALQASAVLGLGTWFRGAPDSAGLVPTLDDLTGLFQL